MLYSALMSRPVTQGNENLSNNFDILSCPKAFNSGSTQLNFATGKVEFSWDLDKKQCHGKLIALRDTDIELFLPYNETAIPIKLVAGETYEF